MNSEQTITLEKLIGSAIRRNLDPVAWDWLSSQAALVKEETGSARLNLAFTAMPRKTGKKTGFVTEAEQTAISKLLPGFFIADWPLDRLSRVWLLMQLDPADKKTYLQKIEALFLASEMNESVALYSALPVLAYPEEWRKRCADGIRSNIATVLEAIMHRNPYPASWLDEPAWNQLVMKAFFTDKDIRLITGLEQRANPRLASMLTDYARERQSAGRSVNPLLWELTGAAAR